MGCMGRGKPGPQFQEVFKMKMVCEICGKEASYNEKLNIYYCKEHGLTVWIEEEKFDGVMPDGEVALG